MRKTDWLQLFAQPEEPAQAGENAGDTAPDAGERQEDFEDLIRGRYKADFDARVRKILDGRLRGLRQEVAQLRQWERERDLRHQAAMGRLSRQEPEIQRVYPEFRWQREMDDPGSRPTGHENILFLDQRFLSRERPCRACVSRQARRGRFLLYL